MTYTIEAEDEFRRLEAQAQMKNYDFRQELRGFVLRSGAVIVDAGSGSGAVSRHLAEYFPSCSVIGFDFSELRVKKAREIAQNISNLRFETASLQELPLASGQVDLIVCRFVLEHLSSQEQSAVLAEFHRVLKPGGKLIAIDVDGWFQNLYPSTPWIEEVVTKCNRENPIDLRIGRKIPSLLRQAGFKAVSPRLDLMNFEGEELEREKDLIHSRLAQAMPFLSSFLGSEANAARFKNDVLHCLSEPNAVLFYVKFIVTGIKCDGNLRSVT